MEDEEFRRTCTFKPTLKTNKKMAVKYDNYMDESLDESSHLNIGIEHIDDIIEDIDRALNIASAIDG